MLFEDIWEVKKDSFDNYVFLISPQTTFKSWRNDSDQLPKLNKSEKLPKLIQVKNALSFRCYF